MKRGWYKESHRHSLAAKGVSTSKYYIRKRKFPKGVAPGQPAPAIRRLKPTEEFITDVFVREQGEEARQEVFKLRGRRDDLKEQLGDIKEELRDKGESVATLRERKREIDSNLEDEDIELTKPARAKLKKEAKSIEQMTSFIKGLRDEQQTVLDRLDTLEGKDRGVLDPEQVLTKKQLERRARSGRAGEPVLRPREQITKAERLESLEGRGRFQKEVEGGDKEDFAIATGFKGAQRKAERASAAEAKARPGIAGAAVGTEALVTQKEKDKREMRAREKGERKTAREKSEALKELAELREKGELEDKKNGKS